MTPEQMAERLAAWEREPESWHDRGLDPVTRRVVCLEPDGPRRTWALYEGGRQVGHARGRQSPDGEWTWEAANAGLDVLRGKS